MKRIVSLCPSLTELVALLGRGDALVGRTRFCVHPAELVGSIESVGGTKDPDVERVVALAPDLVLLNEEENRSEDFAALEAAGLACHTSCPRSVNDAIALIGKLGERLDAQQRASQLCAAIELERAEPALEPTRFAYLIWRKPWMAAGPGTYVDGLLRAVGGVNVVAGELGSYPSLELEALRISGVERVLLSSEPYRFVEKHRAPVAEVLGLPIEHVLLVDGEACTWHGSRTLAGLREARRCLAAR